MVVTRTSDDTPVNFEVLWGCCVGLDLRSSGRFLEDTGVTPPPPPLARGVSGGRGVAVTAVRNSKSPK